MATATVLAHNTARQPSKFSSSEYLHHQSSPSTSSMISTESQHKSSEDNEQPSRQSLPSISEVISGTKPAFSSGPPTVQPGSTLPSPFPSASRSYPENDKRSSPHLNTYPPRQDTLPKFADSPHGGPYSVRPTLPPVTERRGSPSNRSENLPRHGPDLHGGSEAHSMDRMNGIYSHQPHASVPHLSSSSGYQHGSLPHGQVALPPYPNSPRHPGPPPPASSHYDPRSMPSHQGESESLSRQRYDSINRHFETWGYQDALSRIGSSSRTVFNFAEAYSRIASEQHLPQTVPERLPTEREVGDMIANVELMKRSLEQVRELVQVSLQNERVREGAQVKANYEEQEDISMYGGDNAKSAYPLNEVKKRRGRAAPPGRCHSCNRIDTPEWRRGPDGARTLCNACGLHYAKLERKRQLEARTIRPKPEERS